MSKMIQVRDVPDNVHRTLKTRAALAGMSLSDFVLAELRQLAERPTIAELRRRAHRLWKIEAPKPTEKITRRQGDGR